MDKKYLPYKNMHKLMKEHTHLKVGRDSVEQTIIFVEEITKYLAKNSTNYAKYDNRKTIRSKDINLAIQDLLNNRG